MRHIENRLTIALFLLPAAVFFLVFLVYPLLQSGYYSFFNWKGFGPPVDFEPRNYINILTDRVFWGALRNGLLIAFLSLTVQLPLSLALALLVGRDLPGRIFFRTLFFLPYVFSEVITGIIWAGLFKPNPHYGLVNALLTLLIPGVPAPTWLGDTRLALACVFVALTWKYFGFHMLLYMGGLQNIPTEVEEAARIDGASGWQVLLYVTLPLLGSTIRTSVYMSVLGSLQQFGLVWMMTQGGPAYATEMLATYMYRFAFVRFALGYGSAVAVVMLVICLTFSLIYQRLAGRGEYMGSAAAG